jgi:signal peptidase I
MPATVTETSVAEPPASAALIGRNRRYTLHTTSMAPTIAPAATVHYVVGRQPRDGDIVIYYAPEGIVMGECAAPAVGGRSCRSPIAGYFPAPEISRVVASPGETFAMVHGHVIVNGHRIADPHGAVCPMLAGCQFPVPITIPAGHYYVINDNRGLPQADSRYFGSVPARGIVGVVIR